MIAKRCVTVFVFITKRCGKLWYLSQNGVYVCTVFRHSMCNGFHISRNGFRICRPTVCNGFRTYHRTAPNGLSWFSRYHQSVSNGFNTYITERQMTFTVRNGFLILRWCVTALIFFVTVVVNIAKRYVMVFVFYRHSRCNGFLHVSINGV